MSYVTADLVDEHADVVRSCEVQFRQYGKRSRFHGPIRSFLCAFVFVLFFLVVCSAGIGAVLVVDGGASLSSALVGELMAGMAQKNGWAGLVIWGAIRDAVAL